MVYGARLWATRSFGDGGGALANAVPPPALITLYAPGSYGGSSLGVTAFGGPANVMPGVIPPVVYTVTLTGNLPITGALGPKSLRAVAGTLTPTGVLDINLVSKLFAGSLTPVGTLTVHATGIHIAGSLTPSGTLTKLVARAFSGTETPAGVLHNKDTLIPFTGQITSSGTLEVHKQSVSPSFTASLTPAAMLKLTALKGLVASVFPGGSVSFGIQLPQGYAGTIHPAGGLTLTYPGGMTGLASITPTGRVTFVVARSIAGSIASSSSVSNIGGHHFTGALGITAVTGVVSQRYVTISGSHTPSGVFHADAQKRVAGVVSPAGVMVRIYSLGLTGRITSGGSRTLEGPGVGTTPFLADEGTLMMSGCLTNTVSKIMAGTLTITTVAGAKYYEPTVLVPGFVYTKYRRGILLP